VLPWIIGNLALGLFANKFFDSFQLNNYAHVGGLLGGALVTFALRGRPQEGSELNAVAALGWALAVAALVACGMGIYNGYAQDPGTILFGHPL
jgi:hypothetical protein